MFTPEDIRNLRKTLGLTMAELGVRLGVVESTVCLWEQGKRHPAWKHLVKLNQLAKDAGGMVAAS